MDFFENYYDINYPGTKLDLIAIPDFAMGAMENVGAVTFRETLLLIDIEKATRAELSRSVEVVAHELAHMWFGDLVTMKWWDGIWLNEAFASLMEVIASEATYPEFKLWNELNLARSQGFNVDSLKSSRPVEFEVATPEEAEEMFDVLTYQKGSTVLRMFETFIGEENFKKGVRNYLNKHKFKNTHSSDLWTELSGETEYDLEDILPTWIKQEGYPIISIEHNENTNFIFSQSKFLIDGETDDSLWKVPINIRFLDNGKSQKVLLENKTDSFELIGNVPFINNGGWSFFHSAYDSKHLNEIMRYFDDLDLNEKYRLLEDSWMSLRTEKLTLESFLKLIDLYKNETDKNIWSLVSGIFATLHKIDSSNELENYIAQFCKPLLDRLGSEYKEGMDQEMSQLKSLICFLYAKYSKDDKFISHFTDQFNSEEYKDYSDGNYYNLVLSVSGLDKSISINNYLNNFINSDSPQIEARFRSSLPGVSDPETPKVVIEAILNETIRGADAPYLLAGLISHHENGKNAWEIIKLNWEGLLKVMPEWTSSRILDGLPSVYDEHIGKDIQDFIKLNPLPSAEKLTKQKFERLNANIKFKNSINSVLKKAKFV